ncbi:MAG TPA: hypothetical protein VN180_12550, partial [Acidimicrobiia bacterium]|nr:hypothetical protein [Acidimicrobiia bacterium]
MAPAGAVAFSALLLVASLAGAAAPRVVIKAPYKGASVVPHTSLTSSGCGHLVLSRAPNWDRTTGVGGFSVNASGRPCNAPPIGGG